eukprot:CAMPEP_0182912212 /NCGR_PEP_ID=MMETSP0034_2-20130328/37394_1 /TAXON_ID=156128 /ORGANISM="Nephroselmis pyriformis, Strain CCMP717" /LENGTH=187 /DNA_ID=CAMNT_0025048869 /DNA_START=31 /DNA_END=594 /DNA_ORIENTATION=+
MAFRAATHLMRHTRNVAALNNNARLALNEFTNNRHMSVVPDEYGQPKTGGTGFLGTPTNHKQLLEKRPISPHLFGLDNKPHYKFPPGALSSITIRVTGVAQTVGLFGLSWVALTGDAPGTMDAFANSFIAYPTKFAITFPFVFHYLGACRHFVWDSTADHLDNESVEKSSLALFGVSGAVSFLAMLM